MLVCVKDAGLRPRRFAATAGSLTQPARGGGAVFGVRSFTFATSHNFAFWLRLWRQLTLTFFVCRKWNAPYLGSENVFATLFNTFSY